MKLTEQQQNLLQFVKECHGDQVRKYTGEAYWNHVHAVAEMSRNYQIPFGIEIGLCHDLLEDTACTMKTLFDRLEALGYVLSDMRVICDCVRDLTDVYTTEDYPHLNRKQRKQKEATRLSEIHLLSQSVKCADLIHNTESIIKHDKGFAKVYIKEKDDILRVMNGGDGELYRACLAVLDEAKEKLELAL